MISRTFRFLFSVAGPLLMATSASEVSAAELFRDPSQPVEARVQDLLGRLTLEEKAGLLKTTATGVPRLGIPDYDWWSEGLHGVARAGVATVFPQAIGMAATWDPVLIQQVGDVISTEARAKYEDAQRQGNHQRYYGLTFWSPNINIFRDPRWGRGQETYGEDPFLTSRIGVAFVRGMQGDDPNYLKVAACAKHFAVHSGPEALRHAFNVDPDERDFRETYLPAFEALVREGHVEAVMTAYNSVYGKPAAINPVLYHLLYSEWGFDGHVVSDCGAIADLYKSYKVAADAPAAAAQAVHAGLCITCGAEGGLLAAAVHAGEISVADIDVALGKLIRTQIRLGMFDPPERVSYSKIPLSENDSPAHALLARRTAEESIVLLKNEGVLPLNPAKIRRLAVVGPNADAVTALVGNYNGTPSHPVTILAGLRNRLGAGTTIDYIQGCDYLGSAPSPQTLPASALSHGGQPGLQAEYFDNPKLAGPAKVTRVDTQLDWNWGQGNPVPSLPTENLSARWTGQLTAPETGEYVFTVTADNGVRLTLEGRDIVRIWNEGPTATRTARVALTAGRAVPFKLEYFHTTGSGSVAVRWALAKPDAGFDATVARVRRADAIIYVGGLTADLEGEEMPVHYEGFDGGDRTRIELPRIQEQLLQALQGTGKPVICVLLSGSATAIPWEAEHVPAILAGWYPGEEGGTAMARILFGDVSPAGRLPVTFYRSTADLPAFEDYRMEGRTYRYFKGRALYTFGHGLSYTKFAYAHPVATRVTDAGTTARVEVSVTNAGDVDSDEVVQVYANEPGPDARALRSLCGFTRVHLRAHEQKSVAVPILTTALRRWDLAQHQYSVPAGAWKFSVGGASDELAETVTLQLE